MKNIEKLFSILENVTKFVPGFLKDAQGNQSSKRLIKLIGGPTFATIGTTMILSAPALKSVEFVGGCWLTALSVALVFFLKTKDDERMARNDGDEDGKIGYQP